VYDPPLRPVRDLFRRRSKLVSHRTAFCLSFKGLYARTTGQPMPLETLKRMEPKESIKLYPHPANQLIAKLPLEHITGLDGSIGLIAKAVLGCAHELPLYEKRLTLPGVGKLLGLTITREVGDIKRFKTDGDFASYGRAVDARRWSNGKPKGENNAKGGNKYWSWALVEAAHAARRVDEHGRCWYNRKQAKTNTMVATKALARKLAKAAWQVLRKATDYDASRMFPELALKKKG